MEQRPRLRWGRRAGNGAAAAGRTAARRAKRSRRRRGFLIAGVLILLVWSALSARLFIWPDLPPLPTQADAVIELAGPGVQGRDDLAVELARSRDASYLVQSTVPAEAGTNRCLPAVPGVTVLCFHPDPGTTRGEA